MNFDFTHEVDLANKLLICEASGVAEQAIEIEHMLKNIVKLAGKSQVSSVVLDVTRLSLQYSAASMTTLMITMSEQQWLANIRIARLINAGDNTQHLIGEMAEKYQLPIRNFECRSDAMMWLLFNK